VPINSLEIGAPAEIYLHEQQRLVMRRRQPMAALGAPSLQYKSAGFRRHSRAETVRFGTTSIVGLKRSLRHS